MPPPGVAVAVPVLLVHAVVVALALPLKAVAGCVIFMVVVLLQPFASVTVTVYVPELNPETVDPLNPPGFQL